MTSVSCIRLRFLVSLIRECVLVVPTMKISNIDNLCTGGGVCGEQQQPKKNPNKTKTKNQNNNAALP